MIVQQRPDEVRLITQHDHGILSGAFAERWDYNEPSRNVSDILRLTVQLHDFAWVAVDDRVVHWREDGLPNDFMTYPEEEKLIVYQQGIDEIATIHPYAGILLSRHYTAFTTEDRAPMFVRYQRALRARLEAECARRQFDTARADTDFELLKIFDVLSLLVCVAPPGTDESLWPRWLNPSPLLGKIGITATWEGDDLTLDPFPLTSRLETNISYRLLPRDWRPSRPISLDELDIGVQTIVVRRRDAS